MGYRIEYSGGTAVEKPVLRHKRGKRTIVFAASVLLMAAFMLWPMGHRCVRDILLPGDEEVTAAALNDLVQDLSAGEPIGEAVESFCREIIAGEE